MNLLITGASGLIGTALSERATGRGWTVTRLRRTSDAGGTGPGWNVRTGRVSLAGIAPIDAVVHLAGEPVAQRWTAGARRRILESRVQGTEVLGRALRELPAPPRVFISASAIGYYGDRGNLWLDESSEPGHGFLADVCRQWEDAARRAAGDGRSVQLRIGIVLSPKGGALAKMLPPFRVGLGGKFGKGTQFWSWITLHDLVRAVEFVLENEALSGPVNLVAPGPVTNREFTQSLGRVLHRPVVFGVPTFMVRILLGQMGKEALLSSARVRPTRLLEAGFKFEGENLDAAWRGLLR